MEKSRCRLRSPGKVIKPVDGQRSEKGSPKCSDKVQRKNLLKIMTYLVMFPKMKPVMTYQEKPLGSKEVIICKDLKVGVCIEVGKPRL